MNETTSKLTFPGVLRDGIRQAPPFRLLLGLCPALAVTTAMENGFWMGLAVIFVLACSELLISLLRKVIPDRVRIPVYIVIVATFVTVVDMMIKEFLHDMNAVLGNMADAVGVGAGFTVSLMAIGGVRELLGTGNLKLFGIALLGGGLPLEVVVMLLPAGAFFVIGFLMAGLAWLQQRQQARVLRAQPAGAAAAAGGSAGNTGGGEGEAV